MMDGHSVSENQSALEMDEDSRIIIEYIRGLPSGSVVHWASAHHVPPKKGWADGWVDVEITDEGAPPHNWMWTVIGPDDKDGTGPDQLWQFVWPYDLDIHLVYDPVDGEVNVWPSPRGVPPPDCIAAAYEPLAERVGGRYAVHGGWTAATITEALATWTVTHVDREDLSFVWDREAGLPDHIARIADRAANPGPMVDLGDGLMVDERMVRDLETEDPEVAEEVIKAARQARKEFLGEDEE